MRLIKFRAWNPQVKKMGGGVAFTDLVKYDYRKAAPNLSDWIWMQYTGLKDKNGNDLYEGDVCWLADNEIFGEVIWDEGAWCYHWDNIVENLHDCADSLELRGNIYENSELLKVTERIESNETTTD